MSIFRPLVMLAIVVGACFLAYRHTPHHEVEMVSVDGEVRAKDPSAIFTMLFGHVVPAPLVAAHGSHGDEGHGDVEHSDDSHGDDSVSYTHLTLPTIYSV